jgi:hypothetical protein
MVRWLAGLAAIALVSVAGAAHPQGAAIARPTAIYEYMTPQMAGDLSVRYRDVKLKYDSLFNFAAEHNAKCTAIDPRAIALLSECDASVGRLQSEVADYAAMRTAYEEQLRAAHDKYFVIGPNGNPYLRSGNGLVGGTSWILSYDVPLGASREEADRQREELKALGQEQGKDYVGSVDTARYNFAVAIAFTTSVVGDLVTRIPYDQITRGQFSAWVRPGYDQLRGRHFEELGCHSNGAMICLAALQNEDVLVKRVVLYGPQLTAESVRIWSRMVPKQVESVEILINQYDPVPPVSLYASLRTVPSENNNRIASAPIFKEVGAMKAALLELGGNLNIVTFDCPFPFNTVSPTSCHDMTTYRRNRNCSAQQRTSAVVPGTMLPGGRAVSEPPPPC